MITEIETRLLNEALLLHATRALYKHDANSKHIGKSTTNKPINTRKKYWAGNTENNVEVVQSGEKKAHYNFRNKRCPARP